MTKGILDEIFNVPGREEDEDLSVIKEAPDDEQPSGGNDAPAEDNADNAEADNNAEDAEQDQNADDTAEDQGEEDQDNDDQQDNFDIDTDNTDDGEGEDLEGNDQNDANDAGGTNQEEPNGDEASEESKNLKDTYDQLYKDLTPEEKAYRDMVLKNEYKELHRLCGSVIMQAGYFPNVAESQQILKRLIKSLHNFRKYIGFYLTEVYPTKSFYENKFQYEVYLQVFNGIRSIFEDMKKMMAHEDLDSKDKKS